MFTTLINSYKRDFWQNINLTLALSMGSKYLPSCNKLQSLLMEVHCATCNEYQGNTLLIEPTIICVKSNVQATAPAVQSHSQHAQSLDSGIQAETDAVLLAYMLPVAKLKPVHVQVQVQVK